MAIAQKSHDLQSRSLNKRSKVPIAVMLVCGAVLLPLGSLVVLALGDSGDVWPHLIENVLPSSIITTLLLTVGVGLAACVIGVGAAWLVSRYDFPGRGIVQWALVAPLAVPTYISAYCFVELLDFTGPFQSALRVIGGYESPAEYWFPDIRSLPGAIFVMSVVLYPYAYLTCRVMFELQARSILDVSRVLGAREGTMFFRVALPLARPAIATGATLAMLEALNDIGAVEILGVRTLTFAIFDTWLNRSSLAGAAQIACFMVAIVTLLILIERWTRRNRRYATGSSIGAPPNRKRLAGVTALGVSLLCLAPIAAGFLAPAYLLLRYSLRRLDGIFEPALLEAAFTSVFVSLSAALLTAMVAILLITQIRRSDGQLLKALTRLSLLGYAIPGSVLAVGTLYAFAGIDNGVDNVMRSWTGYSTGLLLSGSAAIVIYACSVRFLSIAYGAVEAGYSRISDHLSMVAQTLGRSPNRAVFEVELPLLKRALATGVLLVFVDTMKELSATVLLRPFNFNTLAIFVYERASRARFEDAAFAALVIVAIGLIPVLALNRLHAMRPITRPISKST